MGVFMPLCTKCVKNMALNNYWLCESCDRINNRELNAYFVDRIPIIEELSLQGYNFNKIHNAFIYFLLAVDDNKKKLILHTDRLRIYDYKKIIDFEIVENGNDVISGNMGAAVVGGLLFGVAGAVVGSAGSKNINKICSNLYCKIFIDDIDEPQQILMFINSETNKNGSYYQAVTQKVNEIIASLRYIMNKNKTRSADIIDINICGNCSKENPPNTIFCGYCGTKL